MQFKPGVELADVQPMLHGAAWLYDWARRFAGYGEGTITSGTEGVHSPTSLHYSGWAVDLRTVDLPGGARGHVAQSLAGWLRAALDFWMPIPGRRWLVLLEKDHIHVHSEQA